MQAKRQPLIIYSFDQWIEHKTSENGFRWHSAWFLGVFFLAENESESLGDLAKNDLNYWFFWSPKNNVDKIGQRNLMLVKSCSTFDFISNSFSFQQFRLLLALNLPTQCPQSRIRAVSTTSTGTRTYSNKRSFCFQIDIQTRTHKQPLLITKIGSTAQNKYLANESLAKIFPVIYNAWCKCWFWEWNSRVVRLPTCVSVATVCVLTIEKVWSVFSRLVFLVYFFCVFTECEMMKRILFQWLA